MRNQDDAVAMAFAVLRNRSYRFLAVSPDGVVVGNGSPTLAIDVSRPVNVPEKANHAPAPKKHRRITKRRMPPGYMAKELGYKDIMLAMKEGDDHTFPLVRGATVQLQAMALSNACSRLWGSGKFSIKTLPEGIRVTHK